MARRRRASRSPGLSPKAMVRAYLKLVRHLASRYGRVGIRETAQIRGGGASCACRPRPLKFRRPPKADVRFSSPPDVRGSERCRPGCPPKTGAREALEGKEEEEDNLKNSKILFSCEPVSPEYFTRRLCLGCCVCVAALASPSFVLCVAESVLFRCADAAGGLSLQRCCTGVFIFLVLLQCRQLRVGNLNWYTKGWRVSFVFWF